MISAEIESQPDLDWNKRLFSSELCTIYQTKEWAEILSESGQEPTFVKFIDNTGNIIGQVGLFSISRFAKKGMIGTLLKKMPIKKNLIRWAYGPIVFNHQYTPDIYDNLNKLLLTKNCRVSGSQHPFANCDVFSMRKNFVVQKWGTFVINLNRSKEDLYNNIHKHSGRKNIERSIERGVIIEKMTKTNLHQYVDLYNQTSSSMERELMTVEQMDKLWSKLEPLGYSGFLAKKNEMAIGGLLFSFLNGYIIEASVARSEYDTKNNLYSQDLIKWSIIEWGQENKMNYYDLAGFNPEPQSEKEKGILRYKQKWGGERYDYWIIRG